MGTMALPTGVKRQWREADQSPSTRAEVKKIVDLYNHFSIRLHGVTFTLQQNQITAVSLNSLP
jgi:hypothetical protein